VSVHPNTPQPGRFPLHLASLSRSRLHNGRLLVIACSETKAREPGRIPAFDRYNGPLWQTLRAADPDGSKARVAFLSAHFGFRCACEPIKSYNTRLTPELAQRMIAGGVRRRWPEHRIPHGHMPDGSQAAYQISVLSELGSTPFSDVALVGGQLYLTVMRNFVAGFKELGSVSQDARIVEINGPIGLMRQMLRRWLDEPVVRALTHDNGPPAGEFVATGNAPEPLYG
jgi:hypothetical protein